jgi:hypothetical protein
MYDFIGPTRCWTHTLALSALFSFMLVASPYLLRPLVGATVYDRFSPKTRSTLRAYVVALTHHFLVTPASLYALYKMAASPSPSPPPPHPSSLDVDFVLLSLLPPITFSYLLTDLVFFVVPNRDLEFLVHHGVTGLISYHLLMAPAHASCRWSAFLYCMELSSIPFAASYVFRKLGAGEGRGALIAQGLFFVTFLATRIALFPAAVLALILAHPTELGGVVNLLLVALALLQVYWLVPICKQACSLMGGRRGGGGEVGGLGVGEDASPTILNSKSRTVLAASNTSSTASGVVPAESNKRK